MEAVSAAKARALLRRGSRGSDGGGPAAAAATLDGSAAHAHLGCAALHIAGQEGV